MRNDFDLERVNVHLPRWQRRFLKEAAQRSGLKPAQLIRQAVSDYLVAIDRSYAPKSSAGRKQP